MTRSELPDQLGARTYGLLNAPAAASPNALFSADEHIAVITCARSRPGARSGRRAEWSMKACLARPPRTEPTNDLATGSARVDADHSTPAAPHQRAPALGGHQPPKRRSAAPRLRNEPRWTRCACNHAPPTARSAGGMAAMNIEQLERVHTEDVLARLPNRTLLGPVSGIWEARQHRCTGCTAKTRRGMNYIKFSTTLRPVLNSNAQIIDVPPSHFPRV
jgi:hypothetical protein